VCILCLWRVQDGAKRIGHTYKNCGQKLEDYKDESNEKMMLRKCGKWDGPGPEKCAIYGIEL
jgi:hypothetical protein